jgi:hypothetical protein
LFTLEEKILLRYIIKQKLELAKEVTKVAVKNQKELCKQTEKALESILKKIS